jgi:hypothetical protein
MKIKDITDWSERWSTPFGITRIEIKESVIYTAEGDSY